MGNTLKDSRDVILLEKTIEKHPDMLSDGDSLEDFFEDYVSRRYEKQAIHEPREQIRRLFPLSGIALSGEKL
jgi:hypothetical protein